MGRSSVFQRAPESDYHDVLPEYAYGCEWLVAQIRVPNRKTAHRLRAVSLVILQSSNTRFGGDLARLYALPRTLPKPCFDPHLGFPYVTTACLHTVAAFF